MGTSTNGIICYGIFFDDDMECPEFPWDSDEWNGDIDEWWVESVHGYKPPFQLYDERGNYKDGKEPDRSVKDEYYEHRRKFELSIPKLPVVLENVCSVEYPIYVAAVPSTVLSCSRGCPAKIDRHWFDVQPQQEEVEAFYNFVVKYLGLAWREAKERSQWYLGSYWG